MENARTPINSSEEAVLEYIEQYVDATGDTESFTHEDAVAYLIEQGIERADARSYIEQLLQKSYLYEVTDELRIPPRP